MSHLMADGVTSCARTDSHKGGHRSATAMASRREGNRRYKKTPNGRAANSKYNTSQKGRARTRKAVRRWEINHPDQAFLNRQNSYARKRLRKATEEFPGIVAAVQETI